MRLPNYDYWKLANPYDEAERRHRQYREYDDDWDDEESDDECDFEEEDFARNSKPPG